jgi:protein involved in polysaccharide export with SLBB domain
MKSLRLLLPLVCLLVCFVLQVTRATARQELGSFSVVGEANNPGVFELREGMTIRQEAVLFDGATQKASSSRIVILRKALNGTRTRIPIDLEGILSGTKADMPIVADDIIIIPEFGLNKIP